MKTRCLLALWILAPPGFAQPIQSVDVAGLARSAGLGDAPGVPQMDQARKSLRGGDAASYRNILHLYNELGSARDPGQVRQLSLRIKEELLLSFHAFGSEFKSTGDQIGRELVKIATDPKLSRWRKLNFDTRSESEARGRYDRLRKLFNGPGMMSAVDEIIVELRHDIGLLTAGPAGDDRRSVETLQHAARTLSAVPFQDYAGRGGPGAGGLQAEISGGAGQHVTAEDSLAAGRFPWERPEASAGGGAGGTAKLTVAPAGAPGMPGAGGADSMDPTMQPGAPGMPRYPWERPTPPAVTAQGGMAGSAATGQMPPGGISPTGTAGPGGFPPGALERAQSTPPQGQPPAAYGFGSAGSGSVPPPYPWEREKAPGLFSAESGPQASPAPGSAENRPGAFSGQAGGYPLGRVPGGGPDPRIAALPAGPPPATPEAAPMGPEPDPVLHDEEPEQPATPSEEWQLHAVMGSPGDRKVVLAVPGQQHAWIGAEGERIPGSAYRLHSVNAAASGGWVRLAGSEEGLRPIKLYRDGRKEYEMVDVEPAPRDAGSWGSPPSAAVVPAAPVAVAPANPAPAVPSVPDVAAPSLPEPKEMVESHQIDGPGSAIRYVGYVDFDGLPYARLDVDRGGVSTGLLKKAGDAVADSDYQIAEVRPDFLLLRSRNRSAGVKLHRTAP